MNNAVADALSRLETAEEEFSAEALATEPANEEEEFPTGCPLSCKEMAFRQKKDRAPQNKLRMQPELHVKKLHIFSDSTCKLIAKNNEICVPKHLQHKCAEWHRSVLHSATPRLDVRRPHVIVCANAVGIAQQATRVTKKKVCFRLSPMKKKFAGTHCAQTWWANANSVTLKSPKHTLNFIV